VKTRITYCDSCSNIALHYVNVEFHPEVDAISRGWTVCSACGHENEIDEHENAFDYERRMAWLRWPMDVHKQVAYHCERRRLQWEQVAKIASHRMDEIHYAAYFEERRDLTIREEDEYSRMYEIYEYAYMRSRGLRTLGNMTLPRSASPDINEITF